MISEADIPPYTLVQLGAWKMTVKLESAHEVEQITESSMNQLVGGGLIDAVAGAAAAAGAATLNTPRTDPFPFTPTSLSEFQSFFSPNMIGD